MNLKLVPITLALVLLFCTQFPTRYDRIEPDALRAIAFVYRPAAEGAPGDTISVRVHLAGLPTEALSWQLSYNHLLTAYGEDTITDLMDLTVFNETSYLPDSLDISFIVPDSALFLTKAITNDELQQIRPLLPAAMQTMTQLQLAAYLQEFSRLDIADPGSVSAFIGTWGAVLGIADPTLDSSAIALASRVAATLGTKFSVPAVLFATARATTGETLRLKGDFTIRYNRRFQNSPLASFFTVNHNPAVHRIGAYKVQGTVLNSFDPLDPQYAGRVSFQWLLNEFFPDSVNDTILVEKGYTYFLAADSGVASLVVDSGATVMLEGVPTVFPNDTVITMDSLDRLSFSVNGTTITEAEGYFYDWQYQNLALDSVSMPLDSLFLIAGGNDGGGGGQPPLIRMLPSADRNMTHARLWVTVYDDMLGERYRPRGFTLKILDVYFKYQ